MACGRLVRLLTTNKTSGAEVYTEALGCSIERLRAQTPPISRAEFTKYYKSSIETAAHVDMLPAILMLVEQEKGSERSTGSTMRRKRRETLTL
jgi:hypothetical protein